MRLEFTVQPSTPRSLARSAQRALSLRPPAVLPVAAVAAGFALLAGGLSHSLVDGVLTGLAVAAAWAAMVGIRTVQLGRALAGRGYEPGSTVTADWDADSFAVTTTAGGSRHALADVAWIRQTGSATVLFLRRARFAVVLPSELVPDDVVARTVAAAPRRADTTAAPPELERPRPTTPAAPPNTSQADLDWRFRD